mmetsp:Transcript_44114/g.59818  ORF Transcript_44114/g.59818 Transcript_44114/m.59818 type:complete len:100 (-) Transcript_44114:30-329(-)
MNGKARAILVDSDDMQLNSIFNDRAISDAIDTRNCSLTYDHEIYDYSTGCCYYRNNIGKQVEEIIRRELEELDRPIDQIVFFHAMGSAAGSSFPEEIIG